jgi:hypothetical protein
MKHWKYWVKNDIFFLESFKPGDVYHVDSLTFNKEIVFTSASKYLAPPMQVSHEGGVFRSKTLGRYSEEFKALGRNQCEVLSSFGLINGATHTEFIRGKKMENGTSLKLLQELAVLIFLIW